MGGGSIRVGSDDLEWLERRDARGQIMQVNILNNVCTVFPRTTKFGRIIRRVGEGVFLWVNHALWVNHGPSASPCGVLFNFCIHPVTQNYQN